MTTIIGHKLATIHELETIYSYIDALNMAEVIVIYDYNSWAATG